MKVQFYIQSDSKDTVPVYIRFSDGRKFDVRVKSGLVIDPTLWSAEKWKPGAPKSNPRDAEKKRQCNTVASEMARLTNEITDRYNKEQDKAKINSDWLMMMIDPRAESSEEIPTGLVQYFEFYERTKGHQLQKFSKVKLNVVKHFIERMQRDLKTTFTLPEIDESFKNKFIEYSTKENYSTNTIARNWTFIKTICYHGEFNGITISPKLKKLTIKKERTEKIYLEPSELALIEKSIMPMDHLENAKDWLLISCETGQRVSDFLRFKKDMIRYSGKIPLIEFTQKKTGKDIALPLSNRVQNILKKRKGEFPRPISDQRYNEYIKKVCEFAGIETPTKGSIQDNTFRKVPGTYPKWQLVTSHIGRRTFATNNFGKIPTSLIMSATGHVTESEFLKYIGKTQQEQALQLAQYLIK